MSNLLTIFLSVQQQIRLYHWKTKSYPRHVASGTLYTSLDMLIDNFIETLQGKMDGKRIEYETISINLYNVDDKEIISILKEFKDFLNNDIEKFLNSMKGMSNSDLKNQRDEMLAKVNQTLYLFTLE